MPEFPPPGREALHRMHHLAQQVRDQLAEAGLPVTADVDSRFAVGADVHTEPTADDLGGVYVGWRTHPSLAGRIREIVLSGRTQDPAVGRAAAVTEVMLDAVQRILNASGFTVRPTQNDMSPNQLHVLSGP